MFAFNIRSFGYKQAIISRFPWWHFACYFEQAIQMDQKRDGIALKNNAIDSQLCFCCHGNQAPNIQCWLRNITYTIDGGTRQNEQGLTRKKRDYQLDLP